MRYNSWEFEGSDKERFMIYFEKVGNGYQILCQTERARFNDSYYGILDHGKVYYRFDMALKYAIKYVMHNRKHYNIMINCFVKENRNV